MSGEEIKWAWDEGVPVKVKDILSGREYWYSCILEIIYWKDRHGFRRVSVLCVSGADMSSLRALSSDVSFAKKEDLERCHSELNIQSTQAS